MPVVHVEVADGVTGPCGFNFAWVAQGTAERLLTEVFRRCRKERAAAEVLPLGSPAALRSPSPERVRDVAALLRQVEVQVVRGDGHAEVLSPGVGFEPAYSPQPVRAPVHPASPAVGLDVDVFQSPPSRDHLDGCPDLLAPHTPQSPPALAAPRPEHRLPPLQHGDQLRVRPRRPPAARYTIKARTVPSPPLPPPELAARPAASESPRGAQSPLRRAAPLALEDEAAERARVGAWMWAWQQYAGRELCAQLTPRLQTAANAAFERLKRHSRFDTDLLRLAFPMGPSDADDDPYLTPTSGELDASVGFWSGFEEAGGVSALVTQYAPGGAAAGAPEGDGVDLCDVVSRTSLDDSRIGSPRSILSSGAPLFSRDGKVVISAAAIEDAYATGAPQAQQSDAGFTERDQLVSAMQPLPFDARTESGASFAAVPQQADAVVTRADIEAKRRAVRQIEFVSQIPQDAYPACMQRSPYSSPRHRDRELSPARSTGESHAGRGRSVEARIVDACDDLLEAEHDGDEARSKVAYARLLCTLRGEVPREAPARAPVVTSRRAGEARPTRPQQRLLHFEAVQRRNVQRAWSYGWAMTIRRQVREREEVLKSPGHRKFEVLWKRRAGYMKARYGEIAAETSGRQMLIYRSITAGDFVRGAIALQFDEVASRVALHMLYDSGWEAVAAAWTRRGSRSALSLDLTVSQRAVPQPSEQLAWSTRSTLPPPPPPVLLAADTVPSPRRVPTAVPSPRAMPSGRDTETAPGSPAAAVEPAAAPAPAPLSPGAQAARYLDDVETIKQRLAEEMERERCESFASSAEAARHDMWARNHEALAQLERLRHPPTPHGVAKAKRALPHGSGEFTRTRSEHRSGRAPCPSPLPAAPPLDEAAAAECTPHPWAFEYQRLKLEVALSRGM